MGERNAGTHSDGRQPAWKTIKMTTQKTKLTNFGNNYFFLSISIRLCVTAAFVSSYDGRWVQMSWEMTGRNRKEEIENTFECLGGWLDAEWLEDVRWMDGWSELNSDGIDKIPSKSDTYFNIMMDFFYDFGFPLCLGWCLFVCCFFINEYINLFVFYLFVQKIQFLFKNEN